MVKPADLIRITQDVDTEPAVFWHKGKMPEVENLVDICPQQEDVGEIVHSRLQSTVATVVTHFVILPPYRLLYRTQVRCLAPILMLCHPAGLVPTFDSFGHVGFGFWPRRRQGLPSRGKPAVRELPMVERRYDRIWKVRVGRVYGSRRLECICFQGRQRNRRGRVGLLYNHCGFRPVW